MRLGLLSVVAALTLVPFVANAHREQSVALAEIIDKHTEMLNQHAGLINNHSERLESQFKLIKADGELDRIMGEGQWSLLALIAGLGVMLLGSLVWIGRVSRALAIARRESQEQISRMDVEMAEMKGRLNAS